VRVVLRLLENKEKQIEELMQKCQQLQKEKDNVFGELTSLREQISRDSMEALRKEYEQKFSNLEDKYEKKFKEEQNAESNRVDEIKSMVRPTGLI